MEDSSQEVHAAPTFAVGLDIPEKPVLTFGCWLEEAIYLQVAREAPDGVHKADLQIRLLGSEKAVKDDLQEADFEAAVNRLTREFDGLQLVSQFQCDDGTFLAKMSVEHSIVLTHV